MSEFAQLDLLLYWIAERESVRRRREAGEPRPWSDDPIFQRASFCNVERERDRVTVWIREHLREPNRDNPDVWFLMLVARLNNAPEVLGAITLPLPWDRDRFVAEMAARREQGLPLERAAYTINAPRDGRPKYLFLADDILSPLWAAREAVRPRPGDSCKSFFDRLTAFDHIGDFYAGQIVADTKFTPPLSGAADFMSFVAAGPGSGRWLNVMLGRNVEPPLSGPAFYKAFEQVGAEMTPKLDELGLQLSAQDRQNCMCETFKLWRARTTGRLPRRRFAGGEAPAVRPRRAKPKPIEAPVPSMAPIEAPPPRPYPRGLFASLAAPFIIPAPAKSDGGLRLVFDIETDGLDDATKVHCVVVSDVDGDRVDEYGPDQIAAALAHLSRADYLIGHNVAGYDLPLLRRLHNWAPSPDCTVVDTLITARLILPHLDNIDTEIQARTDASLGKLHGRYSLEAFGVRLGLPKTGVDIDFSKWSPELQQRCVGDVTLTKELWRFLQPDGYSQEALALEHRVAAICNQITSNGIPFDRAAAEQLREQWEVRRDELEASLHQQFPDTKNFNSRDQIAKLLEARGWVPQKRTEKTGKPQIDDELLESLPTTFPEFAGLAEYLILGRRLGQLADGKQAWLSSIGADGRIHGGLIHIGTPHSRAKHLQPNLAQVPNPKRGKPFATECRALFRHPGGWLFVTADQSGLQDRGFAHYLAEFDAGAYARSFLAGTDTHWLSASTLGLIPAGTERDKTNTVHTALREGAKRFRYGFLYGAGAKRAGEIIAEIIHDVHRLDPTNDLCHRRFDGGAARQRFMAGVPGLQQLRQSLDRQHNQHEWVLGLDGRRVPTGAQYKALNRIVTSAEAIVCKRWLVSVFDELCERFRYGQDGDVVVVAWVHDELVCCCRLEIAEQVGEIMVRHAKAAGEHYGLKVPLDAEYKIGRSWAGEPIDGVVAPIAPEFTADEIDLKPDDAGKGDALDALLGAADKDSERSGAEIGDAAAAARGFSAGSPGNVAAGLDELHERAQNSSMISKSALAADAILGSDELADEPQTKRDKSNGAGNGFDHSSNGRILCPFHDDRTPSLQIYPSEDDPHYHCFACGAHGHLDDLLIDWASVPLSTKQTADDAARLKRALALWAEAKPIVGTLAEKYLAEVRGIDVAALPPNIDEVLRFHRRCSFGGDPTPCLVALYRDVTTDEPAGIHRVGLRADGSKINRMTMGRWSTPRAIKLWPAGKQLFLGEGIETALAAATRIQDRGQLMQPAWAAGSSGNIEKFPIVPGVEELALLVDRGSAGEKATTICRLAWKGAGRRVRRLHTQAPGLNDFNDLIRAKLLSVVS